MSWAKTLAELIVGDLADEAAAAAQCGDTGDGVGRGTAARLQPRPHPPVQPLGDVRVDQPHRSLGDPLARDERRRPLLEITSTIAFPMATMSRVVFGHTVVSLEKIRARA